MTPAVQAYHDQLVAQFNARRCSHRRCNMPVVVIVCGDDAVRAPGGILISRAAPDRNYCEQHAPGLMRTEIAA
jgi:hypothetical protein